MNNITNIMKQPTKEQKLQKLKKLLPEYADTNTEFMYDLMMQAIDGLDDETAEEIEENDTEFYLYDFDSFLDHHIYEQNKSQGEEFAEGFNYVFDFLSTDEQRSFIFHKEIKYADNLYSNNYREYYDAPTHTEEHVAARKLFYIVERLGR